MATDLRIEGRRGPVTTGSAHPRFSWTPVDAVRGSVQDGYRILVASSHDLLMREVGDLWDSGWVTSPRTQFIPYEGRPLSGSLHGSWKVRLRDESGRAGPWSQMSEFWVGPLGGEWRAQAIWEAQGGVNDFCYLRRSFLLDAAPEVARVHVFAQDEYKLFVNGVPVGSGPVPCDPFQTAYYDTYDIAALLEPGENVLAARAHHLGAYSGCRVPAPAAFLLQAELDPGTERAEVILTDARWRVLAETPYRETAPVRGPSYARASVVEDFDARQEPVGWKEPGFDDSSWSEATVLQPGFRPTPRTLPKRRLLTPIDAVSVTPAGDRIQVIDFGENRTGWPVLTLRGLRSGQRVRVWYSEELRDGRIVRDRNGVTDEWDAYTARGDALEVFEPDFGFNGFRYLEIEGLATLVNPWDVRLQPVTRLPRSRGTFSSSNETLNRIEEICRRSQENSTQGVLLDGAHREHAQYAADGYIQFQSVVYLTGSPRHLEKFLGDLAQSKLGGGVVALRDRYPSGAGKVIPEWSLFWILSVWKGYMLTGDSALLERYSPLIRDLIVSMTRFLEPETDLLVRVPGAVYPWVGLDLSGPARTPLNCLFVGALRDAGRIAEELGCQADAEEYRVLRERVTEGIQRHLFDGEARYRDSLGSNQFHPASSALALACGVTPPECEEAVLRFLGEAPLVPEAPPAAFLFFETLAERGCAASVLESLTRERGPWHRMLEDGATTVWEHHLTEVPPRNEPADGGAGFVPQRPLAGASRCNSWNAYPLSILPRAFTGVEPLTPGFGSFRVRPGFAELARCNVRVPTGRGRIGVRWQVRERDVLLHVEVPTNTTAELEIPVEESNSVQIEEGGKTIFDAGRPLPAGPGIEFRREGEATLSFRLGGGAFDFVIRGAMQAREL
ncbi:MAG TPA: hypothetical protein ENJ09_02740, partial [Planctomycetes bacterium]|nr:hypothetical protein [Planctomycetota bacterium]